MASSGADALALFKKEIFFYEEILPKINEKLDDIGEAELFPEVIGVCRTNNVIILNDLLAKDYEAIPANRGLTIPEAKSILKKVALFHAICAVLQENRADVFENFKYGL